LLLVDTCSEPAWLEWSLLDEDWLRLAETLWAENRALAVASKLRRLVEGRTMDGATSVEWRPDLLRIGAFIRIERGSAGESVDVGIW